MTTLSISLRAGGSRQEGRLQGAEGEHGGSFTDKLSQRQSPPVLSTPCPGLVWLGTTSASLPPVALRHLLPPLFRHRLRQVPDENALSETCLAAESFPTRVAGQEVSLRAYLRSEGPETPQALCGFTRESLVPALPPLHPLGLPLLPQGSRAGTTTPSTHTWNDACQRGGTFGD